MTYLEYLTEQGYTNIEISTTTPGTILRRPNGSKYNVKMLFNREGKRWARYAYCQNYRTDWEDKDWIDYGVKTLALVVLKENHPCSKCGGVGGWKGWPGYTCFRCHGTGVDPSVYDNDLINA